MKTVVELRIYSPRWGHDDTYTFTLTRESMEISMQVRSAKCRWRENLDPEWSGETLEQIMNNDSIYPPAIFQSLVEHVWKEWRKSEINDGQVNAELNELATWLNIITRAKPDTEFWHKYF